MLFGRKVKNSFLFNLLNKIIPTSSLSRTTKYITLRLQRMRGSPYEISAGFACGVAISMTPFIGMHSLLSILISWLIGASMVSAFIGTFFGNPWTFPLIWYISFEIGQWILNRWSNLNIEVTMHALINEITLLLDIFKNTFLFGDLEKIKISFSSLMLIPIMTVGSIPLVILSWLICYFILYRVIRSYKKKYKI